MNVMSFAPESVTHAKPNLTYVKYSSADDVRLMVALSFIRTFMVALLVAFIAPDGMQLAAHRSSHTAHGRMDWKESNR